MLWRVRAVLVCQAENTLSFILLHAVVEKNQVVILHTDNVAPCLCSGRRTARPCGAQQISAQQIAISYLRDGSCVC
jgi:homoserine kinase